MGSATTSQNWKQDYDLVLGNSFDPTKTLVKHKGSLKQFEMVTIYLSNQEEVDTFFGRVMKRQNFRSKFLVPFEKVYHSQDKNLCGNNFRYELIVPKSENLGKHLTFRTMNKQCFKAEEVMYLIYNICQGLKDLKAMQDQHGNVNLQTIIINKEVLLEDPIVSNRNYSQSVNYKSSKIEGFPSPAILFQQIDSGLRIDKFKEDLFSLGLIALQMVHLDVNVKGVYTNKNKKYQNSRVNFELVSQYIGNIKEQPLKQWIATLLHQSSEQRLNIYQMIQNFKVNNNSLDLLKENINQKLPSDEKEKKSGNLSLPVNIQNQYPFPRPQLTFSNVHSSHFFDSQIERNQGFEEKQGKISFRSFPEVQTINTIRYQPNYPPQVRFSTPTFNKVDLARPSPDLQPYHNYASPQRQEPPQIQSYSIQNNLPRPQNLQVLPVNSAPPMPSTSEISQQNITWQSNDLIRYSSTIENPASQKYIEKYYERIPKYNEPQQKNSQAKKETEDNPKVYKIENTKKQRQLQKQELQKEIQELERLRKQNEQFQRMIDSGATNLFQNQGLSLPQQQIREVTEEDSRVEEGQTEFVMQDYEDGNKYEGFIKDKLRNGYGKFYYKGGSIYDGEWKNNYMNGYGTLFYPEGKIAYQGNWKNDQFHGKGNIYNDNPQLIKGNFDYTNFRKLDNDQWYTYEGQCQNSKKHGKGKLTLSNGQIYEGEFYMDIPHGSGVFTQNRGNKIKGIWSDGILKTIID